MELLNAILPQLTEILVTLVIALAGYLGTLAVKFINEQTTLVKSKTKKEEWDIIVQMIAHTVSFVEQTSKTLKAEEKFRKAQETIIRLANEQGLKITEEQLKVITESFVNEFYGRVDDVLPLKPEGTE